ncbi:uncharacterized protein FFFS_11750 [Fusarium fujikuroi]
MQGLL